MSDETYETTDPEVAAERSANTYVGNDELIDPHIAITAVHVPGSPIARKAEVEASAAQHAEAPSDPEPLQIPEYDGIDSRHPEANLASRSNIVRSECSA